MCSEEKSSYLNLSALLDDGLRELIELVSKSGVAELRISRGDAELYLKGGASGPYAPDALSAQPAQDSSPDSDKLHGTASHTGIQITSPIVGTYYSASSPGAEPFVRVGDSIDSGQTVAIVEAMKIMNEIESEVSGKVIETLVENGQAVEYGQPLMVVEAAPE